MSGRRYGIEVKFQDAPRLTHSMRIALEDPGLRRLAVLYPGDRRYTLERRVDVVPLAELATRGANAVIAGEPARAEALEQGAGAGSGRHSAVARPHQIT